MNTSQSSKSRTLKSSANPKHESDFGTLLEEDKEESKNMSSISKAIQKEKTKQYIIWSWGKNKYGELSHGGTANALIPRGVRGLKDKNIEWISSGAQHSAVVTEEGELYVCGSYLHGKLGIEGLTKVNITSFQPVLALQGMKVKQVECGDYHTLCLLDTGVVYTWGGTLHKVWEHVYTKFIETWSKRQWKGLSQSGASNHVGAVQDHESGMWRFSFDRTYRRREAVLVGRWR